MGHVALPPRLVDLVGWWVHSILVGSPLLGVWVVVGVGDYPISVLIGVDVRVHMIGVWGGTSVGFHPIWVQVGVGDGDHPIRVDMVG